jgi:hypothetical protein
VQQGEHFLAGDFLLRGKISIKSFIQQQLKYLPRIERIEVGERGERYSRTAEQEIAIRYEDIGVLGAFAEDSRKIAV